MRFLAKCCEDRVRWLLVRKLRNNRFKIHTGKNACATVAQAFLPVLVLIFSHLPVTGWLVNRLQHNPIGSRLIDYVQEVVAASARRVSGRPGPGDDYRR